MRNFCFWTEVKIFPNKKMRAKKLATQKKHTATDDNYQEPKHVRVWA